MNNIISMTDLQKLSLKKLRTMKLPLFVLDRKSKKGGFVIQDLESFQAGPQPKSTQKIVPNPDLFWNLREGVTFDPEIPSDLDMYVQQVLTRGGAQDVRTLLRTIEQSRFQKAFERIKNFLPKEVKRFWEGYFGDH